MKTFKLSLFAVAGALFMSFSASAQQAKKVSKASTNLETVSQKAQTTPPGLAFKEDNFNFGDVEQGKPVSHEFTFTNTSDKTILITNVKASCGCTATNYTKTPIKPGETGNVTATYNARNPNHFTKTVTVTTNDSETNKVLIIKGNVIPKDKAEDTKS